MRPSLVMLARALCLFTAPVLSAQEINTNWHTVLEERLPRYGHRNWIVIADSAYPVQSSEGVETVVSHADYFQVLQTVLSALSTSRHVRPIVYTDRELAAISESDAPGISAFRDQLSAQLNTVALSVPPVTNLRHEQLISKLDEASQTFRVLVIKTDLLLPYTSTFLQLDCAYWSPEAEHRLRLALAAQK